MPRFSKNEPIYQAFSQFVERCIQSDRSYLFPDEQIWTQAHVEELIKVYVNQYDAGEGTFREKLEKQLAGQPSYLWVMMADLHFVYYLAPKRFKFATKVEAINRRLRSGDRTSISLDDPRVTALDIGIFANGQFYNMRDPQLTLLILTVNAIKQHSVDLTNHVAVRNLVDEQLEIVGQNRKRPYGMRNILLHMWFPDYYEDTSAGAHKEKFVKAFSDVVQGELPSDIDDQLHMIRQALASKYDEDGKPFSYYLNTDLRAQWDTTASRRTKTLPKAQANQPQIKSTVVPKPSETSIQLKKLMNFTSNIILYGVPGTGKTYLANQFARSIASSQIAKPVPKEVVIQRISEELTLYDTLALAMYSMGAMQSFKVPHLGRNELVAERFKHNAKPNNGIWAQLQIHTDPSFENVRINTRHAPFIFEKLDDSSWKLTDEGIEYVEENLMKHVELLNRPIQTATQTADDFVTQITFHQSFSYEDFIEGWRPVPDEDTDEITYAVKSGVLRRVADRARVDIDNTYILIIDEINRGNIAKIMGELITLLEDDKRQHAPNETHIVLPYSGDTFTLPSNLVIIGTMNTTDRSIALLDVALRRRFAFVEVMPDAELLEGIALTNGDGESISVADIFDTLNARIREHLGTDYQIGHSYFLKLADFDQEYRLNEFAYIWNYQIVPLLQEYFYSQPDLLRAVLDGFYDDNMESLGYVEGDDLFVSLQTFLGL